MKNSKGLIIFGFLLLTLGIYLVINPLKKNLPTNVSQPPAPISSLPKQEANLPRAAEPSFHKKIPAPTITKSSPERRGFCKYEKTEPTKFISSVIVKHLNLNSPEFIVLPRSISSCFKNNSSMIFKIITYDGTSDFMFDYLGEAYLDLEFLKTIPSMQSLNLDKSIEPKKFGFENLKNLIQFLHSQHTSIYEELSVFKIKQIRPTQPRLSSGSYNQHVGIQFVSPIEFSNLAMDSNNQVILGFPADNKMNPLKFNAQHINLFRAEKTALTHPNGFISRINQSQLPKLNASKNIILVGRSQFDHSILNYANYLRFMRYEKIYVVMGGWSALQKIEAIFPTTLPNIIFSSFEDFIKEDFVQFDLRSVDQKKYFSSKTSYWASIRRVADLPFEWNQLGSEENSRFIKNIFARLDLKKLNSLLTKKVILIGHNDFDWTIPLLAKYLENSKMKIPAKKLYWLQEGYGGLQVRKELGLLTPLQEKRVKLEEYNAYEMSSAKNRVATMQFARPPSEFSLDLPVKKTARKRPPQISK